jgi:hypothetical protein
MRDEKKIRKVGFGERAIREARVVDTPFGKACMADLDKRLRGSTLVQTPSKSLRAPSPGRSGTPAEPVEPTARPWLDAETLTIEHGFEPSDGRKA